MTKMTLGQFIREERDKRDISLRELARRLKITPPFLSDIELGRRFPSEDTLKAIAKEFDIDMEKLRQFDHRESLTDFKRLVENDAELSFAFRSTMNQVKAGKLTTDDLAKMLKKGK
jgi:transcriptional regulator with XRE-family HTH domain